MHFRLFLLAALLAATPITSTAIAAEAEDAEVLCHRFAADPFAGTGPEEWSHPFATIDPFRALPPCRAALSGKPDDQGLILANAMAYIAWRKNDEARPMLERLVAEGNASAMLGLAFISKGRDSTALMKKAADAGNPSGMMLFGMALIYGNGVAKDEVGGVRMIRRAAEAGSTRAMLILANFYTNGEYGVGYDPKEAERLVAEAASREDPTAKGSLAASHQEDSVTR